MRYLICFLLFLSIFSCRQEKKNIKITDVSKYQEFVLECPKEMETVNSLWIEINGVINGNATIIKSNGKNVNYKYEFKSGEIKKEISGDWYAPTCILKYKPNNVDQGEINIKYLFN